MFYFWGEKGKRCQKPYFRDRDKSMDSQISEFWHVFKFSTEKWTNFQFKSYFLQLYEIRRILNTILQFDKETEIIQFFFNSSWALRFKDGNPLKIIIDRLD